MSGFLGGGGGGREGEIFLPFPFWNWEEGGGGGGAQSRVASYSRNMYSLITWTKFDKLNRLF